MSNAIKTRDAWDTSIACRLCDDGFRREGGVHVASQSHGMIASAPCERVFAVHVGNATEGNKRPWMAYVDGAPLCVKRSAHARRFSTAAAAYRAATASVTT